MNVLPDTGQAVAFLEQWNPNGPWTLTAITPDVEGTQTKTFDISEDARMWIEARQGKMNMYFAVNPLKYAVTSKAPKEAVAALGAIHVDVDPRDGEDFERERLRMLKALQHITPTPTVIIDSGGGYQGFWKLREPVAHEANTAELESYNLWFSQNLGGDSCHNIDRIMRLPGTVNLPNAKKRAKGREPALAKVVEQDWSKVYELNSFQAASIEGGPTFQAVEFPAELPVVDVDTLPVSTVCKAIIKAGNDPQNPNRLASRSEWLFSVCCELVRKGCDDATVLAVILNPENLISASVLEKSASRKYALRQLERAKVVAAYPSELQEMNELHYVVKSYGGKFRVASRKLSPIDNRERWIFQNKHDFLDGYMHRKIQVGEAKDGKPRYEPLGKWWLEHSERREYEGVVFAPEKEIDSAYFNLWEGFAYKPQPGNLHESYLTHLRENICNGDKVAYEYLIRWLARTVQFPAQTGEVAIVLTGEKGTGKGQFANHFGELFGCHYVTVSDPKHLTGSFNAHLKDCLVLLADEAAPAGNNVQRGVLKALITEPRIILEGKGVNAETGFNYTHIIMASNEWHTVHYTQDERRYLVLRVGSAQKQKREYFRKIDEDLKAGGYGHLLHYLKNLNLAGWDHTSIPVTEAAKDQLIASIGKTQALLMEILHDGLLPGEDAQKREEPDLVCLGALTEMLGGNSTAIHHELVSLGIITNPIPIQRSAWLNPDGSVVNTCPMPGAKALPRRMYRVAPLAVLRERYAALAPHGWPDDGNEWRLREEINNEVPF